MSIQDKFKRINSLAENFERGAENLAKEIRDFEGKIAKYNLNFDVQVVIGENEFLAWRANEGVLVYAKGKDRIGKASTQDILTRKKIIESFPVLLDEIIDKYERYLTTLDGQEILSKPAKRSVMPVVDVSPDELPEHTKPKKIKRRKARKAKKIKSRDNENA